MKVSVGAKVKGHGHLTSQILFLPITQEIIPQMILWDKKVRVTGGHTLLVALPVQHIPSALPSPHSTQLKFLTFSHLHLIPSSKLPCA